MRKMWKVPFRQVVCPTLKSCVKYTIWCHLVIRIFPCAIDFASDGLLSLYKQDNKTMFEQYEFVVDRALETQRDAA